MCGGTACVVFVSVSKEVLLGAAAYVIGVAADSGARCSRVELLSTSR
jgi:hypothetical protein